MRNIRIELMTSGYLMDYETDALTNWANPATHFWVARYPCVENREIHVNIITISKYLVE